MSESTEVIQVNDNRIVVPEESKLPVESNMNQILVAAINKNYPVEFIEKMMDLEERHQKEVARRAYFDALANFKAEAPPLKKDAWNGWFQSHYTSLGMLHHTYNPILGKNGLSLSYPIADQDDSSLKCEARLTHRLGHYESLSMTFPIDKAAVGKQSGQKSRNAIQDLKSTFTYARSVTTEALLGVSGTEGTVDDDGNSAGNKIEFISTDQCTEIEDLINETFTEKERAKRTKSWLAYLKVSAVHEIPANKYKMAVNSLKRAQEGSKKNG